MTMDELAKANGFESAAEMNRLIASIDISTPEKLKAFENWKRNDGTRTGLLALFLLIGTPTVPKGNWSKG